MKTQPTIAFIGTGNMATAIIAGLLKNNVDPSHIWASSPAAAHKAHLQHSQIHLTTHNCEAAQHADIILLCVKPHQIVTVCHELRTSLQKNNPILVSIAAGTSVNTIQKALQKNEMPIIRAMPNIAATVAASATGLYANALVTEKQKTHVETLFRAIGTTLWVSDEDQLDAITAIAGSGPAYLFYFFEAMQKAAESFGIEKEAAKLLVAETAIGAAKMALESNQDFYQLRQQVTSPKGTTQAATDSLSANRVDVLFMQAIEAAYRRARTLSR